jgi:hypothetical protein
MPCGAPSNTRRHRSPCANGLTSHTRTAKPTHTHTHKHRECALISVPVQHVSPASCPCSSHRVGAPERVHTGVIHGVGEDVAAFGRQPQARDGVGVPGQAQALRLAPQVPHLLGGASARATHPHSVPGHRRTWTVLSRPPVYTSLPLLPKHTAVTGAACRRRFTGSRRRRSCSYAVAGTWRLSTRAHAATAADGRGGERPGVPVPSRRPSPKRRGGGHGCTR